jgi:hypothetical protein
MPEVQWPIDSIWSFQIIYCLSRAQLHLKTTLFYLKNSSLFARRWMHVINNQPGRQSQFDFRYQKYHTNFLFEAQFFIINSWNFSLKPNIMQGLINNLWHNQYEGLREPTDNKLLSATLCLYIIIYFKLSYIGGACTPIVTAGCLHKGVFWIESSQWQQLKIIIRNDILIANASPRHQCWKKSTNAIVPTGTKLFSLVVHSWNNFTVYSTHTRSRHLS